MTTKTAALRLELQNGVSGPAAKVTASLKQAEQRVKAINKSLEGTGLSTRFATQLSKLGVSAKEVDKVALAFKDYAKSAGLAGKASDWTKAQVSQVKAWESTYVASLKRVTREQEAFASVQLRTAVRAGEALAKQRQEMLRLVEAQKLARRHAIGLAAGGAGIVAAHRGREIGRKAVVSAAEFDIGVRKQRAFNDLSARDQNELLVPQAKRIGQETQFSNLDVIKAQTKAMQGLPSNFDSRLKAEVANGILENVKNYAMVMEADLETSAEAIRSYLQATGKDISSKEKALAEANKATNQLVKMAKLGGMSDEDVQQYIKYAASSGTAAGLSPKTLMSLAALARRGGLRGDEAGVFVRSTSSKLVSPTKKGRAALTAAGINYDSYVSMPKKLETSRLENQFRNDIGIGFNPAVRKRLDKILSDPKMLADRGLFTQAVTNAVSPLFPKTRKGRMAAADRQKIAKATGTFYGVSAETVDTERLLNDVMNSNMTLAQLNAFLTDKHGGKGAITQNQWDEFKAARQQLAGAGDDPDFAKRKADEIMGGLGGSFENLKGSVDNLITSIGQANEGLLTFSFNRIGNLLDSFSKLDQTTQQILTAIGATGATAGGAVGAYKIFDTIFGSGGLKGSAIALNESAAALTAAAGRLGAGGAVGAAGTAAAGALAGAGGTALGAGTLVGGSGLALGAGFGLAGVGFGAHYILSQVLPVAMRNPGAINGDRQEGEMRVKEYLQQLEEIDAHLTEIRAKSKLPEAAEMLAAPLEVQKARITNDLNIVREALAKLDQRLPSFLTPLPELPLALGSSAMAGPTMTMPQDLSGAAHQTFQSYSAAALQEMAAFESQVDSWRARIISKMSFTARPHIEGSMSLTTTQSTPPLRSGGRVGEDARGLFSTP